MTTSDEFMVRVLGPMWDEFCTAFWAKIEITETCWLWKGSLSRGGYGYLHKRKNWGGRYRLAHRFAYELIVGAIPDGLVLDHLCRVRNCVNPAHLEPVTSWENTLRGKKVGSAANALKTHCVNGHEFDLLNTYHTGGQRECKTCRKIQRSVPEQRARRAAATRRWQAAHR